MADRIVLSRFRVELLTNNNTLYANGRQQLTVQVEYTKTVNGVHTPLNNNELSTLRLVQRDSGATPSNWSSTRVRGIYDEGMRSRSLVDSPDSIIEDYVEPIIPTEESSSIQHVLLFLTTTLPAQPQAFMATVVIDGLRRFNSHGDVGTDPANRFESWVQVTSIPPYVIHHSELRLHVEHAQNRGSGGSTAETFVHYWVLPPSLRIISDAWVNPTTRWSGLSLFWDYARRIKLRIDHNVQSLTVGQIRRSANLNQFTVRLNSGFNSIRAVMDYNRANPHRYHSSANILFLIVDNFGCEHFFTMRSVNNNVISVTSAQR